MSASLSPIRTPRAAAEPPLIVTRRTFRVAVLLQSTVPRSGDRSFENLVFGPLSSHPLRSLPTRCCARICVNVLPSFT